jgi:hypothetical protein
MKPTLCLQSYLDAVQIEKERKKERKKEKEKERGKTFEE